MDNALLLDLYELTMGDSYSLYKEDTLSTFELFVRSLPENRNYLVACGLEDVLRYIRELRFSEDDLKFLRTQKLFSERFLLYLKNFRFQGDVWAMPEGTVCFAQEPLIRVTAPIIQAQVIESFLLNTINLQTMIASKASRVVSAAGGRRVYDFSLRRTHGQDAAIKVARASYIAGFSGTSNLLAAKRYGIPVAGTMAHSFVMSFRQEIDAFLAYAETFPSRSILLVDSYNTSKGIDNAVKVGLYLKEKGYHLQGIRLDSGDIVYFSKLARRLFDKAGLNDVKIFASGNLDEFKIICLIKKGAQVDSFGVGTNMGTSMDAPSLDVIYKITEVTDSEAHFLPTMKLSQKKATYPGRKQVFRIKDKNGIFIEDILGLEDERINGVPLLKKVVDKGRVCYKFPSLNTIRDNLQNELLSFPQRLREVNSVFSYPVLISHGLKSLRDS
ncbi:MAG: nicotinate phosphoribosyltransferase, partial [Candidatus Omnitrophica bacterium]|nr:nicotinate phosphoribosyltransferase [Candidatus Omnitrophota bacterium]